MSKRGLVLISDIHFSINTLKESEFSLRQALETALKLKYTLTIAGDLNDTKAIIRGEVANKLISILNDYKSVNVLILIGNHDLLNEKGKEHSLNFLNELSNVTVMSEYVELEGYHYIPYQTSKDAFRSIISKIPKGSTIIMHQGVLGAFMGEYIQDKSSIDPQELKDFKVYSGHYHRHHTVGTVTYIGTPYTITFSEASDGVKGYIVIDENNRIKQVPIVLRKHIIVCRDNTNITISEHGIKLNDLLWLKISGPSDWLKTLNKEELGKRFIGHNNYRLDLIITDKSDLVDNTVNQNANDLLNQVIDCFSTTDSRKDILKSLAKELLS